MDELLMLVFEETAKEGYNSRMQTFPNHRFSFRFYRKMHKLFQMSEIRGKHRGENVRGSIVELYRPIHSKRRLVVIVLLLLMVIGGTSVASEPLIRWLSNFYVEQNDDHVILQNDVDNMGIGSRDSFRNYQLTEIPEGYTLNWEKYDSEFNRYTTYYVNRDDVFTLKQTWQEEKYPEHLTSDTEPLEDIKVNGFTGYYVEDNGIGSLIISNGVYKLVLDGPFTKDELVDLARKLELSDDPIE